MAICSSWARYRTLTSQQVKIWELIVVVFFRAAVLVKFGGGSKLMALAMLILTLFVTPYRVS